MDARKKDDNWKIQTSYIPKDKDKSKKSPLAIFEELEHKHLHSSPAKTIPNILADKKNEHSSHSHSHSSPNFESLRTNLIQIIMSKVNKEQIGLSNDIKQQYHYYITNGIDTMNIAVLDKQWIKNVFKRVPSAQGNQNFVDRLSFEMKEEYTRSVKKAAVDFVLHETSNLLTESMINKEIAFLKASIVSRNNYNAARKFLQTNSMVGNPMISQMQSIFYQHGQVNLIDNSLINVEEITDHKTFRTAVLGMFEKANEKLMNVWYPFILNIFYQETQRKNKFQGNLNVIFQQAKYIMSDHLRSIVKRGILDLISFFDTDENNTGSSAQNPSKPSILFHIKLNLENNAIAFSPSKEEFVSTIMSCFDSVLVSVEKYPKIESQLFIANGTITKNPRAALTSISHDQCVPVNFTQTYPQFVEEARSKLFSLLTKDIDGVLSISSKFIPYTSLITSEEIEHVKTLVNEEHTVDFYSEEVKKYRDLGSNTIWGGHLLVVQMPGFIVHCEEFLRQLQSRCTNICSILIDKIFELNRTDASAIIQSFETLKTKLMSAPNTVEEMVELQKFIEDASTHQIPKLEQQVEKVRKTMYLLMMYTELKRSDYEMNIEVFNCLHVIGTHVNQSRESLDNARVYHNNELSERRERLTKEVETLYNQLGDYDTYGDVQDVLRYLKIGQKMQSKLDSLVEKTNTLNKDETLFGFEAKSFPLLTRISQVFTPYFQLYQLRTEFDKQRDIWMNGCFSNLNHEQLEGEVTNMWRSIYKLVSHFDGSPNPSNIATDTKLNIEQFKKHLPLIAVLCNPGLRDRHWRQISDIVGFRFQPDETTSLSFLLDHHMTDFLDKIEPVSVAASKEFSFEKALQKMQSEWTNMEFATVEYRDTGTHILSSIDDIQTLLDDHIVKIQTMRGSPYIKAFETEARNWDAKLVLVQDILDEWLKVQSTWLYLEPIFSSEDIMRQMPTEGKQFITVNKNWKEIMAICVSEKQVLKVCDTQDLLMTLKTCNHDLEHIQHGLNQYLEMKRLFFPRFFFLSNDEMLEILSETRDPTRVQPHLKKCFEGVDSLEFNNEMEIVGIYSSAKELIKLNSVISTEKAAGAVEKWLFEVEKIMVSSMKKVIADAYDNYTMIPRDEWVLNWPGQAVLNVSQVFWTQDVEETLSSGKIGDMKKYLALSKERLSKLIHLIRGKLTKVGRSTLEALVVIDVHARDVVEQLVATQTSDVNDFGWTSQLRYYFADRLISVKMLNSVQNYGYEYLGNSGRLVITPLTDRCYRTLLGALQLNLGGAPEGPAGTGKTESVKDLAKALAMFCVVYNCSDGLDYLAMGKFFKGLAAAGVWACFDEFNRIDLEVLSVVAQQILTIQRAKAAQMTRFVFEGTELQLNPSCNVFITMNPGYAGRSELPDNLKALFRPVAMMVPDYALIAEISLYSYGFVDARPLAVKIVATYKLCSEQLSSQDHYDYGMRAVKSVLNACGALKQKSVEEDEGQLVLRAIINVNLPKFLTQDIPLFKGITSDLFPGVNIPNADYGSLMDSIKKTSLKRNLQPIPGFLEKILQVYEMMLVRHGFMLVGESFSGKTAALSVLQEALSELAKEEDSAYTKVISQSLNPKSISMGYLYGQFDPITHEWSDGILATGFRNFSSMATPDRKWIIFDGPVDAIWIENMNTVLDDNKKLCLNSGEIIQLSNTMSLIFEVADLAVASPATVSRCGMIFMEPSKLDWKDTLLKSWVLNKAHLKEEDQKFLTELFFYLATPSMNYTRKECKRLLNISDSNAVTSLMNLFDSLSHGLQQLSKRQIFDMFLFSLIWSVAGVLDEQGRDKFNIFILQRATEKYVDYLSIQPVPGVFNMCYQPAEGKWISWKDMLNNPINGGGNFDISAGVRFQDIVVPTADTLCYSYLIKNLASIHKHILVVGPTGTGKSLYVQNAVRSMNPEFFVTHCLAFSAQTSAKQTQNILESKFEKRRKGVFGPPTGKKAIVFVDDMNMPAREFYGAQPPIELLRQWMDNEGWYNLNDNTFQEYVDLQMICAMNPFRNNVTSRFLRHFNTIGFCNFSDDTLSKIFLTILKWNFTTKGFTQQIIDMSDSLVRATTYLYRSAMKNLLPTPSKSHYTFNLRDYAKVIQGFFLIQAEGFTSKVQLMRLWVHEVNRVFNDRLVNDEDRLIFFNDLADATNKQLMTKMTDLFADLKSTSDSKIVESNKNDENFTNGLSPESLRQLVFSATSADNNAKYNEIKNLGSLTSLFESKLQEYNALSKKPMDLVLFGYAVEHITRIIRVLKQSQGSMLLVGVGGSGRQSLSKLSAYILGFDVFQVEITKSYSIENWRDDLKKVLKKAGAEGKQTVFVFSDNQIKKESYLEDISNILNSGEVPNLFQMDEKAEIMESVRTALKAANLPTPESSALLFQEFVDRCKANLHILLCMSPIGNMFRVRVREFPSLVNCCTIDWFQEWPGDALEMVANKCLTSEEAFKPNLENIVCLCRYFHSTATDLSKEFLRSLQRYNYVTPTSYLELIKTFKSLYAVKQKEVNTLKNRYLKGLEKLDFAQTAVSKMQASLEELKPQLIKTAEETAQMMAQIEKDSKEVQETRVVVQRDELVASEKAAESKAMKDDCEADLAEALPALEAALSALDTLKQADITVLKTMKSPPPGVKLVMEAICIMKDVKPVKVTDTASGKKTDDYWGPSKTILSDMKFLESLKAYDKDNISPAIMKIIRSKYMDNPEFDPEKIKNASSAAEGLCRWVRALEVYDRVAKQVEPKKMALAKAESELKVTMASLEEKRALLKSVENKMKVLENNYQQMLKKKDELEKQVESVSKQLVRAEKLIGSLADERDRWTLSAENMQAKLGKLIGDILVSSAIVAYMGPFTKSFRDSCVNNWIKKTQELGIPCSEEIKLTNTLGDPVTIRSWIVAGLPNDTFSIDNAIILANSSRWPLLIDPQGQANKWIRTMEKAKGLKIMKLSDSDYVRNLENGLQFGHSVLIENIQEELDPVLEPILLKQLFKQGGVDCIRLGDAVIEYAQEFKFYMTTKLRNPHYLPEISTKVTLINFMITPDGLEDQLLGIVIAKERPELEEAKNQLVIQSAENKKQLQQIEGKILEVLSNSQGNILEDETAIDILSSSKVLSISISEKQKNAEVMEKSVDEIRVGYKPIALHASNLFFCVSELANIDSMYQYSLSWFIALFVKSIQQSKKADDVNERIKNLSNHFNESLYKNICRSLFEKDKLLFSFLLCTTIMKTRQVLQFEQFQFLIYGGMGMTSQNQKDDIQNPDCSWISEKMWTELRFLSKLPKFESIVDHVVNNCLMWKGMFESNKPESAIPAPWNERDAFEKLLIMRVFRPDKLTVAIQGFIAGYLGVSFVEPTPFDLPGSFADSSCTSPLIFILSPGADPMTSLIKFADENTMGKKMQSISLGQGQGILASKLIAKAVSDGMWIVLQNCHLALSWLPTLEKICEDLVPEETHPQFRLWLTSYPTEKFPVTLLQNGVKMTNEPPKGLRANLLQSYLSDPISDKNFYNDGDHQSEFEKLLFSLAFFHAIIQERRLYGPIGWNIPYEFTESDMRISVRQLRHYLYESILVPFEALNYIIGQCNYGGRVTDDKDRRALSCLLELHFNEKAIFSKEYKFTANEKYFIPEVTSYSAILDYINSLPLETEPEIFSLHENANITKNKLEIETFFASVMSTQGKTSTSGARSSDQIVLETADSLLERLPPSFVPEDISAQYPISYHDSMNTVLLQEGIRYRALTEAIRGSLQNVIKAVKGLLVMTPELEDVVQCMLKGTLPKLWMSKSYPSMKSLTGYFNDLLKRLQFFQSWIDHGAPRIFWLPGFYFTQSFLTGCLQNYARKMAISIDLLDFDFELLSSSNQQNLKNKKQLIGVRGDISECYFVDGIFLEGARWDEQTSAIAESLPRVLYDALPVLCLRPMKKAEIKSDGTYDCPLYKTTARRGTLSTTGHSTNYVMTIRLSSSNDPKHWVRRGVAGILALND